MIIRWLRDLLAGRPREKIVTAHPRLVIAESRTSTWHYHLRILPSGEKPSYGGLPWDTKALCGKTPFGWDTRIPLETWGNTTAHFCVECSAILAKIQP